ncbi:MAG: hypothetical protein BWY41_00145 [Candidatus Atribacteria bacterium ADurb.Bin276]|uniref:Retroviral aspartyl protease n=1 Tax=Candidatus Atribacter allofermentans TaxID=1852833 RepID=A0A1V5T3X5_9BACT|nr:MAG: hypothetical protein BWY41_00145 [Candidatus Atribacteria bacterium ADurb.Bin276]
MPIHNVQCPDNDKVTPQQLLEFAGPLLWVEVSVPSAISQVLNSQKQIIPNPINGKALIDTGASKTCVDESILKTLNLKPVGENEIATPQGTDKKFEYPVKLEFPGSPIPPLEFNSVIGVDLKAQDIAVLIGRDILCHCILIMNGPAGNFTLSF